MPDPRSFKTIRGSLRSIAPGAHRTGACDASEPIAVTVAVRRNPAGGTNPCNANGSPVSRAEFADRYGATQQDLHAVIGYAKQQGLEVLDANAARRTVHICGSRDDMNASFLVDLGRYAFQDGSLYRGREGLISIPEELDGIVRGVFGLDNRRAAIAEPPAPAAAAALSPLELATRYDFPAGDGAGETIGILGFEGHNPQTTQQLFAAVGKPVPPIRSINIATAGTQSDELSWDIFIAKTIAPAAEIAMYTSVHSSAGWIDAVKRAIHPCTGDPTPSVISISFGLTIGDDAQSISAVTTASAINELSATFCDAVMLGREGPTIFVASGDSGAGKIAFHVEYPASDPWVTSCGGTQIDAGGGEGGWPSSGGGVSEFFVRPAYQITAQAQIPRGGVNRGVPDVAAMNRVAAGAIPSPLGTSAVAPLYAGLIARINSILHKRFGFLNRVFYANADILFTDIDTGNNGYPAGPGWDAVTGWGCIKGSVLLELLR